MSAWAKPGVKCVCVKTPENGKILKGSVFTWPIKDQVYTVSRVGEFPERDLVVIALAGFDIGHGFDVAFFRPLITKTQEQDVALFRHILDGLPVGESV